MIKEWAQLGMVLPVEDAPASLPIPHPRVEQGRVADHKLYDVTAEKKYQLTEDVEALFRETEAVQLRPSTTTPPPRPKRAFRQGQI
jgi:hypothetical protein